MEKHGVVTVPTRVCLLVWRGCQGTRAPYFLSNPRQW